VKLQPVQIRGVMLDMARTLERQRYYHALLPRLASWGYNAVFAHFTDDQGCAMQFDRRPSLATPHAFTQAQMRRWIGRAADMGLAVIPEIESFGHTRYIHGRRKYRALAEPAAGHFNALNPFKRESKAILRDLVEETAEVFDAPFIHAGLDEVNFGASPEARRALRSREKWELFADHVNVMHELVTRAGRRMMMWGDHVLREPRMADRIPRDVLICDWHYRGDVSPDTVARFTRKGFEVIGCPATSRSGDLVMPAATTLINLQRFARVAHAGGRRVVGLCNTMWLPCRMIAGVEQFAFALGGAWFEDPEADPAPVLQRFVRQMFGLKRPAKVAEAIWSLSATMATRDEFWRMIGIDDHPELGLTACEVEQAEALADEAGYLRDVLRHHRRDVGDNRGDYDGLILAADVAIWAGRVGVARTRGRAAPIRTLKRQGRELLRRVKADWRRHRYADDLRERLQRAGPEGRRSVPAVDLTAAVKRLGKG